MLLVFDTCLGRCSVGLGEGATPVAERSLAMARGHAEALVPMIGETIASAGAVPADITRIAVTAGPGSFTGVRVGIAAARGLALALDVPAAGFTTLEALAMAARMAQPGLPVLAAIAARGGQLYYQPFDAGGRAQAPPELADTLAVAARYRTREGLSVGSGADSLAQAATELVPLIGIDAPPVPALLRLAAGSSEQCWRARPSPVYLRPPDASMPARPAGRG